MAFVDVPGHERFIANMLCGAGVVAQALFVVAADAGWSAQSVEHLEILDLLGIGAVAVAIPKAALVDTSRIEEVTDQIRGRVAGTSLGDAPIVVTEAVAGVGLDELQRLIVEPLEG